MCNQKGVVIPHFHRHVSSFGSGFLGHQSFTCLLSRAYLEKEGHNRHMKACHQK